MIKDPIKVAKGIALSLLFGSAAYSQEELTLITTPELKISYVEGPCDVESGKQPYEFAFLKIENLTNTNLHVGFNIVVQFEEGCAGCNGSDESLYYQSLSPNQIFTANCGTNDKTKVYLQNPNFSGAWHFQQLKIENLVVE
ncbi:hypothetical protein [Fluviicola taffensis]|uniref:Uncharacterized protein n=1 Tax=Fluviicola taffensis (strain DSM 16823 / NCIMB 13979 / RW262) TaxID=755732 RepID=F2IIN0_FLUTR|nr:hypothetical protein [Fluviicola taffensis]AEA45992.1 hypothetical protein Fluta_4030 [Fluviicola taffensis DSM 16823]